MCERGRTCPFVAAIYRGCENPRWDRTTCVREKHCYWDGNRCREPLLRVTLGDDVLGVDTGSPYTVLTQETCGGGFSQHAVQTYCQQLTENKCRKSSSCRWNQGECSLHVERLRYVSGDVPAVPWSVPFAAMSLHEDLVPYCSSQLFPQNKDGLIGMQAVQSGHAREAHTLLHHIAEDDPENQVVVMDKVQGTVCVGKHCLLSADENVEERVQLESQFPMVQHDGTHLLLLDTGSTKTIKWPEFCQIGNKDLEYLEVHPEKVRYKLSPTALDQCEARGQQE